MEYMKKDKENELKRLFERMREKENSNPINKKIITPKKIVTPKKITPVRKRLDRGSEKTTRSVKDMILRYEEKKRN